MPKQNTAHTNIRSRLRVSSMRSYILTPDDILPRRHVACLGMYMLGSVVVLMLAIVLANLRLGHAATPAQTPFNADLSNALLYRACVNEARFHARTVHPYPQESRHVELIEEGHMLWRRTEILDVDVTDMSVDNGCLARRDQQLHQEALQPVNFRHETKAETSATPPAMPCIPQRDAALQSHYLLLSLCSVDMAPRAQAQEPPRKKAALRRPST